MDGLSLAAMRDSRIRSLSGTVAGSSGELHQRLAKPVSGNRAMRLCGCRCLSGKGERCARRSFGLRIPAFAETAFEVVFMLNSSSLISVLPLSRS